MTGAALPQLVHDHREAIAAWLAPTPLAIWRRYVPAAIALVRFLKGARFTMANLTKLPALIIAAVALATTAYKIEQIETDPNKDDATKRAEVLPLLPQLLPTIDRMANLPDGKAEEYVTPEVLAALYDGAVVAEHAVEKLIHQAPAAAVEAEA